MGSWPIEANCSTCASNHPVSPLLFISTISGNSALSSGGGIHASGSQLQIESSYLHANTAYEGAGAYVVYGSVLTAVSSVFSENVATTTGGGVMVTPLHSF